MFLVFICLLHSFCFIRIFDLLNEGLVAFLIVSKLRVACYCCVENEVQYLPECAGISSIPSTPQFSIFFTNLYFKAKYFDSSTQFILKHQLSRQHIS